MNYIYDIIFNFNDNLYDFFEWGKKDTITHVKKTPVFKTDTQVLKDLVNKNVLVSNAFLEKIKNKTEIFKEGNKKDVYMCILTDEKEVVSFLFNSKGDNIKCSSMLLDEKDEVLEISECYKDANIEYNILSDKKNNIWKNRFEVEGVEYLTNILNDIVINNDSEKLKYIYYEYFNKKSDNFNIMHNKLVKSLDSWNNKHDNLYDLIKLSKLKKQS